MTAPHSPIILHPESSSMPVPRWTPTSTLRELAIVITSERREALAAWKDLRESLGSAAIEDAALITRDEFGKTICVEPLLDITDVANAGVGWMQRRHRSRLGHAKNSVTHGAAPGDVIVPPSPRPGGPVASRLAPT